MKKTIKIETNLNGKFLNDFWIHIVPDSIIPKLISEEELKKNIIEWEAEDQSIEKVQSLCIDLVRMKIDYLGSVYTYMSHGLDRNKFFEKYNLKKGDSVAVFVYQKIKN